VSRRAPNRVLVPAGVVAAALTACSFGPQEVTHRDRTKAVAVSILDERGLPVDDATFVDQDGDRSASDFGGVIRLDVSQPVAGVVYANGKLPEPVAIGTGSDVLSITVYDRVADDGGGERIAMHFGGDTMLGRRYQQPIRRDTPRVDSPDDARDLMAEIAPLMAAADLTTVNLETVIGTLPDEDAYPGKIFLIQSPPLVTEALRSAGVDAVMLGNNHTNDWQDRGVINTLAALDSAGLAHVGAGMTAEEAQRGRSFEVGSRTVAVISLSGLSGDRFNGSLPERGVAPPDDVTAFQAWQFETRSFSFGSPGEPGYFPPAERVARELWDEFERIEPTLAPERAAELWSAMTAEDVFPQLQDWVARRGHGGAGLYQRAALTDEIARLRRDGAETVVVQFHSGFQFTPAPSDGIRRASQVAVDAGADMVVSHHPHVLQGVEWYRGAPVVYSLGNFLFDQNFHATYPSAFVRAIVDDTGLVDLRFVPIMLDRYRPVPATDAVAERIVRQLAGRSVVGSESDRIVGSAVGMAQLEALPEGFSPAGIVLDRNTGVVQPAPDVGRRTVSIEANVPAPVGACTLLAVNQLPPGVEYGTELFGWGEIDDGLADRRRDTPLHLQLPDDVDSWSIVQGDDRSTFDDALRLSTDAADSVDVRNVSLVPVARNSFWATDRNRPIDLPPRYSLGMDVRLDRSQAPTVTLSAYTLSDEELTKEPESTRLREVDVALAVSDTPEWHAVSAPLPSDLFQPVDGQPVDGVFFTIESPPAFRSNLDVDNIELIEWRGPAQTDITLWAEVDYLQAAEPVTVEVDAIDCSAR
jgi:poly-gamma-glutamate capsule biosynthesis protein CapA/YwtB (metallophosphatase superfamily)